MGKQSKARPSPDNPRARLQAVEGQILEPELPRCRVTLVKTSWPTRYSPAPGSTTLEKEGDYAVWGPGIGHSWQAEEDSIVITVRWPSIPSS